MAREVPPGLLGSVAHMHAPMWAAQRIRAVAIIDAVLVVVGRGDGSLCIATVRPDQAFRDQNSGAAALLGEQKRVREAEVESVVRSSLAHSGLFPSYREHIAVALGERADAPLPVGAWPLDGARTTSIGGAPRRSSAGGVTVPRPASSSRGRAKRAGRKRRSSAESTDSESVNSDQSDDDREIEEAASNSGEYDALDVRASLHEAAFPFADDADDAGGYCSL